MFGPKVGRDHGDPHRGRTRADNIKRVKTLVSRVGIALPHRVELPGGLPSRLVHDHQAIYSQMHFQSRDQGKEGFTDQR